MPESRPSRTDNAVEGPTPPVFDRETHSTEFNRLLALSDGVFAIALTLLVLDLALPIGAAEGPLFQELMARQAHFGAFAISLLFVGSAWWSHHHLFAMLRGVNGKLVAINFLYLGLVALLPFVQGVLAAYPREPLAYALFAGVLAAIGGVDTGLFMFARRSGLVSTRVTEHAGQVEVVYGAAYVLVLLVSMPVAYLIGPYVAFLWMTLPFMGYCFTRAQSKEQGHSGALRSLLVRFGYGRRR